MIFNNNFSINNAKFDCTKFEYNFASEETFQLRVNQKEGNICSRYIFLKNKVTNFLEEISELNLDFKYHDVDNIEYEFSLDKTQELSGLLKTLSTKAAQLDELKKNNIYTYDSFQKLDHSISQLLELSKSDYEFISTSFLVDSHWSQHLFKSFAAGVISASAIAYFYENMKLSLCGSIVFGVASYSYQFYKNYYQPNHRIENLHHQLIYIEDNITKLYNEIINYENTEY